VRPAEKLGRFPHSIMENSMYNELEHLLDALISGLMNSFVMWLAIAFSHYVYTRSCQSTQIQKFSAHASKISEPSVQLSLPYSSEILIPVSFSILTLLQTQTIAQLKAIAKDLNLSGYSKLSKATLVKRIIQEQQRHCFYKMAAEPRT
jgi:hypothetical protein